jgi:ribose/xylose/arabinose/galactoside ABC-type transport system permease subunit
MVESKLSSLTVKDRAKRLLRDANSILVFVIIVLMAMSAFVSGGKAVKLLNIQNILGQVSSRGIASIGQLFVMLAGGIDISVGGMAQLSMCTGALLMSGKFGPTALAAGIGIMLLVGLAGGLINGLLVSRLGIVPLIVTLCMWLITEALTLVVTGPEKKIGNLPPGLAFFNGYILGVPVLFIIFIAVAVTAYFVLNYTSYGRSVYATGGNPVSAFLCGVDVKKIKLTTYAISGFLAGLAGLAVTSRSMSASGPLVGPLEFDTITALSMGGVSFAGGRGGVVGSALGVIILGLIGNTMNLMKVAFPVQSAAKGAIILIAIVIYNLRQRKG